MKTFSSERDSVRSDDQILWNYATLCERLSLKSGTAYALVYEKRIPHVRLGRRMVRFDPAEIQRWLEERKVSARQGGTG